MNEGIVGKYEFEPTGDPSVGPITVLQAGETFEPFRVVVPKPDVVNAARG